jgi:23S rRNA (uracil1939-C5)-methyltransferase
MNSRAAVVIPGEQIELTIDSINHKGEGVGRYMGVAVFVPFTIPGEKVIVEVAELKKNYVVAKIVSHIEQSGQRIEPRCPAFDTCGGSQFQHIGYQLQLDLKRRMVEDALHRIGKITGVKVDEPLGMKIPGHTEIKPSSRLTKWQAG